MAGLSAVLSVSCTAGDARTAAAAGRRPASTGRLRRLRGRPHRRSGRRSVTMVPWFRPPLWPASDFVTTPPLSCGTPPTVLFASAPCRRRRSSGAPLRARSSSPVRLAELEAFAPIVRRCAALGRLPTRVRRRAGPGVLPLRLACSARWTSLDGADGMLASVVVYWFDDGRHRLLDRDQGRKWPPGGYRPGPCAGWASELLHGGHTPDRFDIAVCVDPSGPYRVQRSGACRGLAYPARPAASGGPTSGTAVNEGFRYVVDGAVSTTRSTINVFNPAGDLIESRPFTAVRGDEPAEPTPC